MAMNEYLSSFKVATYTVAEGEEVVRFFKAFLSVYAFLYVCMCVCIYVYIYLCVYVCMLPSRRPSVVLNSWLYL